MARTNKYTSINFNHIYDKNLSSTTPNPPSSTTNNATGAQPSYSSISSSSNSLYKNQLANSNRNHGRMLVLTRPVSKPISTASISPLSPSPQNPPAQQHQNPDQTRSDSQTESDRISLRPMGRTGLGGSLVSNPVLGEAKEREIAPVLVSPKPNKFVPPHLRPGFQGREERPEPVSLRGKEMGNRQHREGFYGSPGRFVDDGRPKSGGYERMRRGGESDLGFINRPRSSGNRPNSSG